MSHESGEVSSRFSGLMSRWTTDRSCMKFRTEMSWYDTCRECSSCEGGERRGVTPPSGVDGLTACVWT